MINELFKVKFPFAYNYFTAMIDSNYTFPQSILLEGSDTKASYYFALELARVLNCQGDKTKDCECTNCKWIKSYTHPAINNVSQIHFKPEDDETKTQISQRQAREIEKSLAVSSDYHRFYIFFSSGVCDTVSNEYGYNDIDFLIQPLTYQTFSETTINAMLKSIEEPPQNTTFVFLTKSKEDILPTIVSRSLVFKLFSQVNNMDYRDISQYMNDYFNLNYIKALNIAENLLEFDDIDNTLNQMIAYLTNVLVQNTNNDELYVKISRDISYINEAIKHSRSNMSNKTVLEALFLKIARGY